MLLLLFFFLRPHLDKWDGANKSLKNIYANFSKETSKLMKGTKF
jgi:hypothetical protein